MIRRRTLVLVGKFILSLKSESAKIFRGKVEQLLL